MGVKLGLSHRLKLFENMVLMHKRAELTGDWRKLHSEELHDEYCSSNDPMKDDEMGGACGTYRQIRMHIEFW
jgi:hypothetical protein